MGEVTRFPRVKLGVQYIDPSQPSAELIHIHGEKIPQDRTVPIEPGPSKNSLVLQKPALPMTLLPEQFKAPPPTMHLSGEITVPLRSLESAHMTRTWIANMQAAVFDLEKSIARLVKESDGGSRRIPELQKIHQTFEHALAALKK